MITDKIADLAGTVLHAYEHNQEPADNCARLAKEVIETYAGYGPAHRETVVDDLARIKRYFGSGA